MAGKFKKGQIVYQASLFTCSLGADRKSLYGINGGIVIARLVDACGKKQVTFYDRGNDSVFKRTKYLEGPYADGNLIFATAAEAFEALKNKADVYSPKLYSDDSNEWFNDVKKAYEIFNQPGTF